MRFEQALIDIKNMDWKKFDIETYRFTKKYQKYGAVACKSIQRYVDFLKSLGYERKEIPRPHDFKPKDFFIPDKELFSTEEYKDVELTTSKMLYDNDYLGIAILQWAKMCDKGYEITKGHEDLFDELLIAILNGIISYKMCERMIYIGNASFYYTGWSEPFYSKTNLALILAKILDSIHLYDFVILVILLFILLWRYPAIG